MSRILVVDDKAENLYYLEALLSAHGHDVDTARHGAEALTKARLSNPDLVVSDLLMPIMDGYTLLRHWKADPLLHSIKFLVYTATYTEAEDERLALSLGADAFILKPSEPEHFMSRLAEVQANAVPARAPAQTLDQHGDTIASMQSYSETLIRKLEEKTLQLQETNRSLQEDILVREAAEARLHLLNSAVLQSADAVLITDAVLDAPGPHIIFANPAFTRMTGYSLDEILGKTPRILQGPRTDPQVLRRMREELARGRRFSAETVNYRKDGSEYDQEWQVSPIVDAQNTVTHYVAIQRDVTARNRADRALLDGDRVQWELAEQLDQERQRLLAAQRVAQLGNWENDLATGHLIWSDEIHRIHETLPGDFVPTYASFMQFVHPDDRPRVDQELTRSIEKGEVGVIEHRVLLPDGRIKHVEERWEIEVDAEGAAIRALGTCQDVSERVQAQLVLWDTSARLQLATQSAGIGIWDWDLMDNTLLWDAQMLALYGLDAADFGNIYEAWVQCLHPEDAERVQGEISDAVAGIRDYNSSFRVILSNGEQRDIEGHGLIQRAADGTPLRLIGCNRDITAHIQADRRIRYLNRVHAMTSGINSLIVRARSRDELFHQACSVAVKTGGFRVAMIGVVVPDGLDYVAFDGSNEDAVLAVKSVMASRPAAPSPMAARAMREGVACVSNASQMDQDVVYRELHVRYGIHSMAILPILIEREPVGVIALYATELDFFHAEEEALLTELAGDIALAVNHLDQRDKLAFLSFYDELTGLANRRLFLERVGQFARSAAIEGGQLALLIFDLERFKNINDSLGRDAGDQLLMQVATWLTRHVGDANLLARLDADHFGVVFPLGQDPSDFARDIEHMMAAFQREAFELAGETLRVAARAGIAIYPSDGEDANTLFERAEAALKKANARSARYLFYAEQMSDAIAGRLALESQLRIALEKEQFVLHYQPKVNLRSGLLSGVEALIRWNNPQTGLMPPGLFIPVLEETGMINEVGRWALQQAIADWRRWRGNGLPAVPIAVNVSPLQLRDPAFISQLEQAISVDREASQGLELEITESMIMDDVNLSIAKLEAIRSMGIKVAIDDFGTGFSSLGYLGKLPIDTLKIDRMFIVDMIDSAGGLSMVSTMLALARSLRLKVVAEGVETTEQADLLRLLNCDEVQGYLVSRPLACDELETRFLVLGWRMT